MRLPPTPKYKDDLDLVEPPKNPHNWSPTTYVCLDCGITQAAIENFPQLRECSGPPPRAQPVGFAPTPDPA